MTINFTQVFINAVENFKPADCSVIYVYWYEDDMTHVVYYHGSMDLELFIDIDIEDYKDHILIKIRTKEQEAQFKKSLDANDIPRYTYDEILELADC